MIDPETKAKAIALVQESIKLMEAHRGKEGLAKLSEASMLIRRRNALL